MFVDISDEKERTEQLQKMLRYLSFANSEPILRVSVTGTYDLPTQNAVKHIQNKNGLPETGVADYET